MRWRERGAELMVRALAALERGTLRCVPQPAEGVTYAAKIGKDETRIDFARPAGKCTTTCAACRRSQGPGSTWPRASGKRERLKVLRTDAGRRQPAPPGTVLDGALTIACGEGAVRLLELQRAGKRPMAAAEFLRGLPGCARHAPVGRRH